MRLGLIGFGAIGATLLELLDAEIGVASVVVLVRAGRETTTPSVVAGGVPVATVTTGAALLASAPDVVVECAGHGAVAGHAPGLLEAGVDVIVVSIGALADDALAERLRRSAAAGGARAILPAGAVGGVDVLAALSAAGPVDVSYTGSKPPRAWAGSPAEQRLDLDALQAPATFFDGTAREAAMAYPKNANVAATLALAGAGFDRTRVSLVADPGATGNSHTFEVVSSAGRVEMRIENAPSRNAKTSLTTIYSVLREIRNRKGPMAI